MRKIATATIIALTVLATSPVAAVSFNDQQRADAQAAGLVEMKSRYFDEVYGQSTAPIAGLTKIYIEDLDMENVEIDQPDGGRVRYEWELTEKDRAGLNEWYRDAMAQRIEKLDGYQIVNAPGTDVITISAELLELDPTAPKDDFRSRDAGTSYYTEGAGEMTIAIEVSQGDTVYLELVDDEDAGRNWGYNSKVRNQSDVKWVFKRWADRLVKQMDWNNS